MQNEQLSFPDRQAAKCILYTPDNDIVLVAGKRGMLNLPGGGIDGGEMPEDSLYRELQEELGLERFHLGQLEELCGTWAQVTTAEGEVKRAVWNVYEAALAVPVSQLDVAGETTRIDILSPRDCLTYGNMSVLAKQAIHHSLSKG